MNREETAGISGYITDTPGIEGKLKSSTEDFIVEEIPTDLSRNPEGKYNILKIRLTNWDTNRFLMYLARYLRISRKRITYCGTKDKRGITTQFFCINSDIQPKDIIIKDAEILDSFKSDRMLNLGDLNGNRFIIDLKLQEQAYPELVKTVEQLGQRGGFPNFFGLQRFGNIRTNTHRIGKLIVFGEYEKAAMLYLYDPEYDQEDYRLNFHEHNDPSVALKEFPERLNFERALLGYMLEHGNLQDAFNALPRSLSMMFVHAYQSYIFNRILSLRISGMGNLTEPLPGDVALKVDSLFNAEKGEEIQVNRLNVQKISGLCSKDAMRVTIPIFGYESRISQGEPGEMESRVLDEEKVDPDMFRVQGYGELSSKGERRIVSSKPVDFMLSENGKLNFSLGRGKYATSFIREITKDRASE